MLIVDDATRWDVRSTRKCLGSSAKQCNAMTLTSVVRAPPAKIRRDYNVSITLLQPPPEYDTNGAPTTATKRTTFDLRSPSLNFIQSPLSEWPVSVRLIWGGGKVGRCSL